MSPDEIFLLVKRAGGIVSPLGVVTESPETTIWEVMERVISIVAAEERQRCFVKVDAALDGIIEILEKRETP